MKIDREVMSKLENILFKYERQAAAVDVLQSLISEGGIEVTGIGTNSVNYSLYEIWSRLNDINEELSQIIKESEIIE